MMKHKTSRRSRFEKLERRVLLAADLMPVSPSEPSSPWSPAGEVHVALEDGQRLEDISALRATDYELFLLDNESIRRQLNDSDGTYEISIPRPDGSLESFQVYATEVMATELAQRYPLIRTFKGYSIDDPSTSVTLDHTPQGFHAYVFSHEGSYYVDPYLQSENRLHASYYVDGKFEAPELRFVENLDLSTEDGSILLRRGGGGPSDSEGEDDKPNNPIETTSGDVLRTYRLAVATTAEYTAFHGGTVASGLSAVVTAVNRVSGIYERELSIRMQLIGNNDQIIYTNAASDPYTNNDDIAMLGENQSNLDNVIGNGNYDIGHVFSTSGGGVASLGSVGINSRKAQGTTGLPNPIGDPFYVDYVAHEMGHQFGGNHTFNGDSGNCSGGNRNGSTAYEPGSGSTIQAYAGICGNDNIQNNSDAYFHFISLDEMVTHVDTVIPGVGTRQNTGNSVPTVNAGANQTIPARTPFELTAVGADGDVSDTLTFGWEQADLGAQQDVNAGDNGSSPIFRSWTPTTNPTRVFPRLSDLLNNTTVIGETLPTTNRDLNFRVTARDNRADGGAINTDDVRLTVVDTGSGFEVTSPNTALTWPALSNQTVTWAVAGTTGNGINAENVDIFLSTDGGLTYPEVLATAVPNDGSHSVLIPNVITDAARVKVKGSGNVFFDISNTEFSIIAADDFGDAPNSYGTLLADNGPRHAATSLMLGTQLDTEGDGVPNADASGDGLDEDGIRLVRPLVAGETGEFEVTATANAKLDFFADVDGDGVFEANSAETFSADVVAGTQIVNIPIPASSGADLFTRFRISTAGGLGPLGAASDGEVEDYRFVVYQESPALDFGDAPSANYATLLADNGARHIVDTRFLGSVPDGEEEADDNAFATGDQSDDGVIFRSPLTPGAVVDVDVNSTGGVLEYFVDFNADGDFGASESFTTTIGAGDVTVPIPVPIDAVIGTTFARFRISGSGGVGPLGLAQGGEVEDYQVAIREISVDSNIDNFDASNDFDSAWTLSSTGANAWMIVTSNSDSPPNHAFVENISSVSDARMVSRPVLITSADSQLVFKNFYDTEPTYDGGVLEISIDGGAFDDIINAGGTFAEGGYNGTIDDGFSNPLANRSAWTGNSTGYIDTIVNLPTAAVGKSVQFMWRMGTDSSVTAEGWRVDTIRIDGADVPLDFGDAGGGYPTILADDGATHAESTVTLGALIDYESDATANSSASGDDTTGTDDEDGVTVPSNLNGGRNDISVEASHNGILNAWIDFNDDGDWSDPGEQVVKDVALGAGSNVVAIDVPEFATSVQRTARFRFSTQSALSFDGLAADGEVEDYRVDIVPPIPDVLDVNVNAHAVQRSNLVTIDVPFDTEVAATSSSFEVRNRETNTLVSDLIVTNEVNDGKTTSKITFGPGDLVENRANGQHSLIDGNYELRIIASQVNSVVGGAAMSSDFLFGQDEADNFFRFFGDQDSDRDVDIQDLGFFGQAFRTNDQSPDYDETFDFNGDGDVDIQDLGQFGIRFRNVLSF